MVLIAGYDMSALCVLMAVLLLRVNSVLAAELCLVGDFDAQLQNIIQSQTMTSQGTAHILVLLSDVRKTLMNHWKDVRVSLFGSLLIGLGTKASDIDLFVQTPNSNGSLIADISNLFQQEPALYSHLNISTAFTNPVLTFYHIPTQTYCDIIDERTNGFDSSKIFQYYFNLDKRNKTLGLFLKFWSKVHDIIGSHKNLTKLQNYTLYTLIIFFLQQKDMVPSGFILQGPLESAENHFTNSWSWDGSFNKLPHRATNIDNLYKLLRGFFEYYSELNFQDYIVSPFAGRLIDRRSFMDVKSIPQEFSLYKTFLTNHFIAPLVLDSEMCIQDIFEHNINIVTSVGREEVSTFISLVKYAAKMYNELPSDRFLGAILTPTQDEIIKRKGIDTIRHSNDYIHNSCINVTLIND